MGSEEALAPVGAPPNEIVEELEWLESIHDEQLALLNGSGG